jgi:predicted transcriptional regulator of viral defense system
LNASEAVARLMVLNVPVIRTKDAAAVLGQSLHAAQKTLTRLAANGLVRSVRHGLFWIRSGPIDVQLLPELLSDPYPSYLSLQTALYLHGMVSQIPAVTFAVTLARSGRIRTPVGEVSFHHVAPRFFGGFEIHASGVKLAIPEKALLDVAYLGSSKTRLFTRLPELTLPKGFKAWRAEEWLGRIGGAQTRERTQERFRRFVQAARRRKSSVPAPSP